MPDYDYLPHNWATNVVMDTAWSTQVETSNNRLAEVRRNLIDKPRRTIGVRWSGLRRSIATRVLFELLRAGDTSRRVPIYQDVSLTTAASSSTTINCPTEYRRFYAGQTILIAEHDGSNPQWSVIASLTASAITTTGSLSGSYAAGSLVYPVLLTEVLLSARMRLLTDQVCEMNATFAEVDPTSIEGAGSYPSLASYGYQQINSFAFLLGINPEWAAGVEFTMTRPGTSNAYARTQAVNTRGPRGLLGFSLAYTFQTRAEFWSFLQFFDAHRGRACPFWIESPLTLFEVQTITTTYVDVVADGALSDYTSFVTSIAGGSPWLLIEKTDGTKVVVQVTGATQPGSIRLAATIPSMTLAEIRRCTLAYFVRFDSDALVERWLSASVSQVEFSVIELLRHENESDTPDNDGFFGGGTGELC